MDSTTKLAIGAGVGLAALVGLIAVTGGSSSASTTPSVPIPPVPPGTPDAKSFQPGSTYEFSLIDPTRGVTAAVQGLLKMGGWQVISLSNMGEQSGAGMKGTGYVVKATYAGTVAESPAALGDPLVLVRALGPL